MTHFDNTARAQTVTAESDPWLHRLLWAVAARTGYPLLCNTGHVGMRRCASLPVVALQIL